MFVFLLCLDILYEKKAHNVVRAFSFMERRLSSFFGYYALIIELLVFIHLNVRLFHVIEDFCGVFSEFSANREDDVAPLLLNVADILESLIKVLLVHIWAKDHELVSANAVHLISIEGLF